MSSDTDSPCQKGALLSSLLWILGIHLLSLPLFARFLNSRRNTRRGTDKRQMNVDFVTDNGDISMITIGKEGTKSYATYMPDFREVEYTENMAVEIVENYPTPPDGKRYHLCTIDADQRDMDCLRDAILQSSPVNCYSPGAPAHAIQQLWNILYQLGHLNEAKFRAGQATLGLWMLEITQGN